MDQAQHSGFTNIIEVTTNQTESQQIKSNVGEEVKTGVPGEKQSREPTNSVQSAHDFGSRNQTQAVLVNTVPTLLFNDYQYYSLYSFHLQLNEICGKGTIRTAENRKPAGVRECLFLLSN